MTMCPALVTEWQGVEPQLVQPVKTTDCSPMVYLASLALVALDTGMRVSQTSKLSVNLEMDIIILFIKVRGCLYLCVCVFVSQNLVNCLTDMDHYLVKSNNYFDSGYYHHLKEISPKYYFDTYTTELGPVMERFMQQEEDMGAMGAMEDIKLLLR